MTVGIEIAIIDRLEAISAVTNITSRIRAGVLLPSDDYPAVRVLMTEESSFEETDDLEGLSGSLYTEIQVDSYAENYADARALDWAVRYGITTQTGTAAGVADYAGTIGSLTVRLVNYMGSSYSFDDPDGGNAAGIHTMTSAFTILSSCPS